MLDKKISDSEQVANLKPLGMVIFSFGIAHADDVGVLPGSLRVLKGMLIPLIDLTLEEFDAHVQDIVKEGLWTPFEYSGKQFYRLPQWSKIQTLKRDRQPGTILPIVFLPDPKDTWKFLEDMGFQMESEEKRREGKRREEKVEQTLSYLEKLPEADLKEFNTRFEASEKQIISKAESLVNYCRSKGKTYRDYKAFLLNALKKDFPERRPPPAPPPKKEALTPEQLQYLEKISREIAGNKKV